jgi:hypothetical protein
VSEGWFGKNRALVQGWGEKKVQLRKPLQLPENLLRHLDLQIRGNYECARECSRNSHEFFGGAGDDQRN